MTQRLGWVAVLAPLALVLGGCDGGAPGDVCESGDDCESGICSGEICVDCTSDSDCEDGQICMTEFPGGFCASGCDYTSGAGGTYGEPGCEDEDFVCAQWGEAGAICLAGCDTDDECGEAYGCTADGYCRPACKSDAQCGAGRSCDEGSGTCIQGHAEVGAPGSACGGDGECSAGVSGICAPPDNGWPGGACLSSCKDVDGGAGACPGDSTCIVFDAATDDSWCMQSCGSNFDCRAEYYCQATADGAYSFCMPRCNFSSFDFCASASLVCEQNSGACVPAGGGAPASSDIEDLGSAPVATNREFGDFSFQVGNDVSAFVIAVTSDGGGTAIPYRITTPSGREVFNVEQLMNSEMRILPFNDGSFGVLYPNSPRLNLEQGQWRFSLYNEGGSGTANAKVIYKRGGANITGGTLDINAFIISDAFGANPESNGDFQAMMGSLGTVWGSVGLNVGAVNVITVSGDDRQRFQFIRTIEGADSDYRRMVQTLSAQVSNQGLNFYFVDTIEAGQAGFIILGIAAGIPGIPVLQGNNTSGVAVSTIAITDAGLSAQLGGAAGVGQTMAHEGGHWLGLYHTTEQPGTLHDPLPDTVECSASRDRDGSGFVSADECGGNGAQYLMFWEADLNAREVSPNQAYVILRNPAVK